MSEAPNCAIYITKDCPETCPLNRSMDEKKQVTNQIAGLRRIADLSKYKRSSSSTVDTAKLIPVQVARLAAINTKINGLKNNCEFEK